MNIKSVNKIIYVCITIICISFLILGLCSKMFKYVETYYQVDEKITFLKNKLRPMKINIDSIPIYKGNKSYTLDKETIYMCLYDEHGQYYPDNFLIYVLLHELAHYFNHKDIGHTPAFFAKFKELLVKAELLGIYDPSQPHIRNYCPGEENTSILNRFLSFLI